MEITAAVVREKFGTFSFEKLQLTEPRLDEAMQPRPEILDRVGWAPSGYPA